MRLEGKTTVETEINNVFFNYVSNKSSKEKLAGPQRLARCNLLTRKSRHSFKKLILCLGDC